MAPVRVWTRPSISSHPLHPHLLSYLLTIIIIIIILLMDQVRGTRESVDQAKHLIGGVIAMGPGFLTAAPSNNQQQQANETTFGQTALEQARALARHQVTPLSQPYIYIPLI